MPSKKPIRLFKNGAIYSHFCHIFYILHNIKLSFCIFLTIIFELGVYKFKKVCYHKLS